MWQAVKDKKRRLAQNFKESRRRSTASGDDDSIGIARTITFDADFVDDRTEFKEYLKSTKDIQKKVTVCTQNCLSFLTSFKDMCETFDEMEGGYGTSRGEKWLADVDRFISSAILQIEGSSNNLLEVLRTRYQAAYETQAGIKKLIDRETDLRSYERRVAEAQNASKPKPETIQKFTVKQETAKNDCLQQTISVKSDLEFMKKTKLTAHQPAFNNFFKMCMNTCNQLATLSNPEDDRARVAGIQGGNSSMSQAKEKAKTAANSAKAVMGGMMGGGSGDGSNKNVVKRPSLQGIHGNRPMLAQPPKRAAPVPAVNRTLPPVPTGDSPPPLPPKQSFTDKARNGMQNAKEQVQQHKEQASKEQKAAVGGMAMGYMMGGTSGALKSAKGSFTTAAKSHGKEFGKNNSGPPNKAAPVPGGGPPNKAAPVPGGGPPNKAAPVPGGGPSNKASPNTSKFYSLDQIKSSAKAAQAKIKTNVEANMEQFKNNKTVLSMSLPMAKALYDFEPENSDELKLNAGDEIFNVEEVEDSWLKGTTKDGRKGVFPSNYVERIKP
jgi:hypothetical protein